MAGFKVVSIDMFGTLVDVLAKKYVIWQRLLKDRYSVELAEKYASHFEDWLFQLLEKGTIQEKQFVPVKSIYEICFSELFSEFGLEFNPAEAAQIWAYQHLHSSPYGDSELFLNSVGKEYPICVASDTDEDMLEPFKQLYPFDHIFISEQLRSYKTSADNKFFSEIVNHYGVKPEQIIHIGDSSSDIIGASQVGIITCWLNRKDRIWPRDIRPDYEVNSLIEAASILGVNIDSQKISTK